MGQVAMQEILDLLHDYIIETERFCTGWWSWIVNPSSRQLDGGNLEMFFYVRNQRSSDSMQVMV